MDDPFASRKGDGTASGLSRLRASRHLLIGALGGAMSHELNNVVSALSAAVEMIAEDTASGIPLSAEDVETLRSLSARMEGFTASVAHLTSNLDEASPSNVLDAASHVASVLKQLGRTKIASVVVLGEPALAVAPRAHVDEVLFQLVANAVDAFKGIRRAERRVTLTVSSSSSLVECTVADNGGGIPKEELARVLEPYFSTKPRAVGLGLTTAARLAHASGGNLVIESVHGEGTSARLTLPRARRTSR